MSLNAERWKVPNYLLMISIISAYIVRVYVHMLDVKCNFFSITFSTCFSGVKLRTKLTKELDTEPMTSFKEEMNTELGASTEEVPAYPFTCSQQMKHQCHKCNRFFKLKCSLLRHLRYTCGKGKQFKCPYCTSYYKWRSNVYKHVRKFHKNKIVSVLDIADNCFYRAHWL